MQARNDVRIMERHWQTFFLGTVPIVLLLIAMMDPGNPEQWKLVSDLAVGASALVTAAFAVYGIQSWRHEAAARIVHDASFALLQSVFRMKRELELARSPWVSSGEVMEATRYLEEKSSDIPPERIPTHGVRVLRWRRLIDSWQDVEAHCVPLQALVGDEVRSQIEKIDLLLRELRAALDSRSDPEFWNEMSPGQKKKDRQTWSSSGKDNWFNSEVTDTFESVVSYLRMFVLRQ